MDTSALLTSLNPPQQEAVKQVKGPVLVLAGAGSGKTRVLTHRIAYIIQKGLAKPQEILAVTFTNKAAGEMKRRIESLLNMPVQPLWIGTFHSISTRMLHQEAKYAGNKSNITIYDIDDQENQIKRIMEYLNINRESITPRQVQYTISEAKNKLKGAREFEKETNNFRSQLIAKVFWEYEVALRRNNALDFDDLIVKPIEIFTAHPEILEKYQKKFKYILIDEYQDTNKAQYYWVKLLAKAHHNLCVVGDEDQSIYRWRGADIGNILNFEKDYPESKVIRLEQNYRSTQTILTAANAVVANNLNRIGKNLWSEKGDGDVLQLWETQDETHEAASVVDIIQEESVNNHYNLNEFVILYRTNAQSRALEEQLRRSAIPYSIVGGTKFYERKEIKDILAYLKLLVNPSDSVSLQRIINFPTRGIGKVSLDVINRAAFQNKQTLYDCISRIGDIEEIGPATQKRINDFYGSIEQLRGQLKKLNAYQITEKVIKTFGLKNIYENTLLIEDETRLENINELLNSVEIFVAGHPEQDGLQDYLDEVSLVTDIDRWDPDRPSVTLMTLHSAKGLEFPVVIICGLEDGLFPISRNYNDPDDLEEERRLFYVGMTRAKEKLYLLHAQSRHRFGRGEFGGSFRSMPSRFISELPKKLIRQKSFQQEYSYEYNRPTRKRKGKIKNDQFPLLEKLPDESSDFKIGQYVEHEVFGKGQVLGVERSNLGTKLTIQFQNKTLKKLIAEYAHLTIRENLE
ncbi:MAG: UvrD-helicase domain-containing protein [Calditrichota bacterium]